MGSPSASLRPTPPCATNERGFAPQREQRPECDLPPADAETYMLVGLRWSLASTALAPYLRAELVVRVRSSVLVPQFEAEGHGNQLGVAVPHQLRAGRVACAPEPPAEARDQTDGVAEARRRRQLA